MNDNQEAMLAMLDEEGQLDSAVEQAFGGMDFLGGSKMRSTRPQRGAGFTRAPSSRRVKAKANARKAIEKTKQRRLGRRDTVGAHIPAPVEHPMALPITSTLTGTGTVSLTVDQEYLDKATESAR